VKDLRLAGIAAMEAANYLVRRRLHQRFGRVSAKAKKSAPATGGCRDLTEILAWRSPAADTVQPHVLVQPNVAP
jgi:hypothetical protein